MTEAENIELVIQAIKKVSAKRLRIIELANAVPIKNGAPDREFLEAHQPEINLAVQEAKVYGSHTIMAVDALVRLKGKEEV